MIIDAQALLSDTQGVTSAAGSDSGYDLGAASNPGVGKPLYVVSVCDVAMTDSSSDSTLDVIFQTDSDPAFGSATNIQTLFQFPVTSAIGTVRWAVVPNVPTAERYCRVYYSPNNGNLSTGSFTTFITADVQAYKEYADAVTIG